MVISNVIVDVTISCHSFVFSQSRPKVSGLTNLNGPKVTAFDVVYCSLSIPANSDALGVSLTPAG